MAKLVQNGEGVSTQESALAEAESPTTEQVTCSETLQSEAEVITVAQTFHPILIGLKLASAYIEIHTRCRVSVSYIWCVVVNIFLWANCVRVCFAYSGNERFHDLMHIVLFHIWVVQNSAACTYLSLVGSNRLRRFMQKWESYRREGSCTDMSILRTFARRCVIVMSVLLVPMTAILIFTLVTVPETPTLNTAPFSYSRNISLGARIVLAIYYSYNGLLCLMPMCLVLVCCRSLCQEFHHLTTSTETFIDENEDEASNWLEDIRLRHLALCKLVKHANHLLSPFLVVAFMLDVPVIALHGFVIIGERHGLYSDDFHEQLLFYGMFGSGLLAILHISVITQAATTVSVYSRTPHARLHSMDISKLDASTYSSLQMFMNRMCRDNVGLTAGIIKLEKGTLVTVLSLIASYVVVMIRFGLSAASKTEPSLLATAAGPTEQATTATYY